MATEAGGRCVKVPEVRSVRSVVSIHLRRWTSAPREVPHGVAFC
eukprot:gene12897-biopygen16973